MLKSLYNYRN
ncbi:rCG24682 [Rattus norvegicus]|uniref:RCG24682 n=1 Tax=Rattus norvegicus TaxID=10116 RepID=A6JC98_RAT|nr:rCG24682 [Rattus norvegicus]